MAMDVAMSVNGDDDTTSDNDSDDAASADDESMSSADDSDEDYDDDILERLEQDVPILRKSVSITKIIGFQPLMMSGWTWERCWVITRT